MENKYYYYPSPRAAGKTWYARILATGTPGNVQGPLEFSVKTADPSMHMCRHYSHIPDPSSLLDFRSPSQDLSGHFHRRAGVSRSCQCPYPEALRTEVGSPLSKRAASSGSSPLDKLQLLKESKFHNTEHLKGQKSFLASQSLFQEREVVQLQTGGGNSNRTADKETSVPFKNEA